MMAGFQAWADALGNLHVTAGVFFQPSSGVRINVGSDGGVQGDALDNSGGEFVAVQAAVGTVFVGGNGRNLFVSGLTPVLSGPALPIGFFLPNEPGFFRAGEFVLEVTGPSAATISDDTDVVAILTTGGAAPEGSYLSTTYGATTYNGGADFTLTVVAESATPVAIPDAVLTVSEGSATEGMLEALDAANYQLDTDTDWTVAIASDGSAELRHLTDVMATRATGIAWNPVGTYEATALGKSTFNLTDDEPVDGEPWQAIVRVIPRRPRAGIVYLEVIEAAGVVTGVNGPFFGTMPANTSTEFYAPLVISDGLGGLEQLHTGMLVWAGAKPPLQDTEMAGVIAGVATKATPVDADGIGITDSAAGNALKLLSFANLWIWVRKLTDTRYLTPEDAPGLTFRLAADALPFQGTSTIANNAAVSAWRSSVKCSVGSVTTEYGVTQATGANQPVFKTSIQNSLPGVLFDGSNDYMQASVPLTSLIGGYQRTVYIVARPTALVSTGSGGTYSRPQIIGNASQFNGIALEPSGSNNIIRAWDYDVIGQVTAATAGVAPNGTILLVHRHKDGVSSISVNQGAWVTGSTLRECNNSSALQVGTSGGAAYYTGYVFDVLLCNLGHSDTVVAAVGTALRSKWGF